jgi:hypothetical protein
MILALFFFQAAIATDFPLKYYRSIAASQTFIQYPKEGNHYDKTKVLCLYAHFCSGHVRQTNRQILGDCIGTAAMPVMEAVFGCAWLLT